MRRDLFALAAVSAIAVSLRAQQGDDYAISIEQVGTTSSVLIVGSWAVSGIQGWSWGVCHDPAAAAVGDCAGYENAGDPCEAGGCSAIECPVDMATSGRDGTRAGFHSINVYEDGLTQGVILDFGAMWTLPARDRFEMLEVTYVLKASAARLDFCDSLGSPAPIRTVFSRGGKSFPPISQGLTLQAGVFTRGNADADERVGIGDAVFMLMYIFRSGTPPPCLDAADVNDDGKIDIGDPIALLTYLFASGAPPPSPHGVCGVDPTPDSIRCERFPPCWGR